MVKVTSDNVKVTQSKVKGRGPRSKVVGQGHRIKIKAVGGCPTHQLVGGATRECFHITFFYRSVHITGQSGFLTFTDYVGLDTDILITF